MPTEHMTRGEFHTLLSDLIHAGFPELAGLVMTIRDYRTALYHDGCGSISEKLPGVLKELQELAASRTARQ